MLMTVNEFVNKIKNVLNYKTLYVSGCFGAPMTPKNKERYKKNNAYNKNPNRQYMIEQASEDTFGFDCVCLIKGILWGWNGDVSKNYGGAGYAVNGVPDIGADGMFTKMYVQNISKDFANIKKGAIVHMSGHVGVYVGDGMVVECSPKWENKVQLTILGNLNSIYRKTGNIRMWDEYGYLPCVDYSEEESVKENDIIEVETIVRKNGVEVERSVINVP